MAVDIVVPPLSQTMDTVVLVDWLKAVGEYVVKGEPLFVIETDKANLEIESPASGTLSQILAEPGSDVAVRSTIGVIAAPEEQGPGAVEQRSSLQGSQPTTTHTPAAAAVTYSARAGDLQRLPLERRERIFASPRARGLAQQEGVQLADVTATGPQQMIVERDVRDYLAERQALPRFTPVAKRLADQAGLDRSEVAPTRPGERITRADVERALAEREAAVRASIEWFDLSPTRRTIARRMAESHQSAAEVTLTRDVDATELVLLREHVLADLSEEQPRPTLTDFLVRIVARQLRQHLYMNVVTDGERLGRSEDVHVAVAVDTERGLLAPVLRNADKKSMLELAGQRAQLVQRALEDSVTPEELSGGTFTITNLGSLGVDAFTPIINSPQAAILGVGRVRPAPAVHEDQLCVRLLMFLSLTFDHRLVDGAPAARFLKAIAEEIEAPESQAS